MIIKLYGNSCELDMPLYKYGGFLKTTSLFRSRPIIIIFLTRLMCTYVLLCLVFKVPPDFLCTDNINECLYGYIKFRVTIFKKPFYDNDIYSFIFTKKTYFSKI